jgi:tyrosyl-tRNA synthetase
MSHDAASRPAQKRLAYEVTKIVHGEDRAESVQKISNVLFGGAEYSDLEAKDFRELEAELPTSEVGNEYSLVDFMVESGLASSNTEARRFLSDSAVYINGSQLPIDQSHFTEHDFIHGYAIVRRGKNTLALAKCS